MTNEFAEGVESGARLMEIADTLGVEQYDDGPRETLNIHWTSPDGSVQASFDAIEIWHAMTRRIQALEHQVGELTEEAS